MTLIKGHIIICFNLPQNINDYTQLTKRQHRVSQLEDCKVLFLITTGPNALAGSKVKLTFETSILNKTRAAAS